MSRTTKLIAGIALVATTAVVLHRRRSTVDDSERDIVEPLGD
jgi:hypothetical protein